MRIVVTGADGALGRGVARALVEPWPRRRRRRRAAARELARLSRLRDVAATLRCARRCRRGAALRVHSRPDAVAQPGRSRRRLRPSARTPAQRAIVVRTALILGRHVDDAVLQTFAAPVVLDVDGSARPTAAGGARPRRRAGAGAGTARARPALGRRRRRRRRTHHAAGHRRGRRPTRRHGPWPAAPVRRRPAIRGADPGPHRSARRHGDRRPPTTSRRPSRTSRSRAAAESRSGRTVHDIPWRLPRVLEIPAVDAPAADGVEPVPAGPGRRSTASSTPRSIPASRRSSPPICPRRWPGPFSPSSASVTVLGTRAAGLVISERLRPGGAVQREMSVRTTGVFGHRLYAGITTGHFMAHTVPFIDPALVLSGFFGHTEDGLELFGEHLPPVEPRGLVRQLRGGLTFANCLIGLSAGFAPRHRRLRRRRRAPRERRPTIPRPSTTAGCGS